MRTHFAPVLDGDVLDTALRKPLERLLPELRDRSTARDVVRAGEQRRWVVGDVGGTGESTLAQAIDSWRGPLHNQRMNVNAREAVEMRETPFGSVGIVHDGADLQAWWIWKDNEAIDPDWNALEHEDLLYVIEGTLRLELEGEPPRDVAPGECFVIPAGRRFRGYRWPRDGEPCLFLAVTTAG